MFLRNLRRVRDLSSMTWTSFWSCPTAPDDELILPHRADGIFEDDRRNPRPVEGGIFQIGRDGTRLRPKRCRISMSPEGSALTPLLFADRSRWHLV